MLILGFPPTSRLLSTCPRHRTFEPSLLNAQTTPDVFEEFEPALQGTLAEALSALPAVTQHFDRAAINRLTDPANYLGLAPQMVDRAVELSRAVGA